MKRIVVLLSSYNGDKYIREQLESILYQKLNNIELSVIIRDDGSSDHTVQVIKEICKEHKNIRVIEGKNVGFVASFFYLMKHVNNMYDFYALADQDDVWSLNKLQRAIYILEHYDLSKPQLYQASSLPVNADLVPISKPYFLRKSQTIYNTIIQNISAGHTYVFNQALLDVALPNLEVDNVYMHDSYLTNVAMIYHGLHYDKVALTYYRQHDNNRLGENDSFCGWIKLRIKRIIKGDNKLYSRQIEYIFRKFGSQLSHEENTEICRFLNSRKYFLNRLRYILHTKLYRQTPIETFAFKLLYLLGGYN